jgi:hypothetical protein
MRKAANRQAAVRQPAKRERAKRQFKAVWPSLVLKDRDQTPIDQCIPGHLYAWIPEYLNT